MSGKRVLLIGATGFVGQHLYPRLRASGYEVRCVTRNRARAQQRWPDRAWIEADLADERGLIEALDGCRAAYYLAHSMGDDRADFRRREVEAATRFRENADATGLQRIVYLGGVAPRSEASEHLRSRLEVGEALRAGVVPTIELRASMIVGHGSQSWLIVRDLAARLPIMVLPRWLRSRTCPIGIDDVTVALEHAPVVPLTRSAVYDLPGPEILSGRMLLEQTAGSLGLRSPIMLQLPVLSPGLSAHWIRWVTRANWAVARELVAGLTVDLIPDDQSFWTLIGHTEILSFRDAARRALAAESAASAGNRPSVGLWPLVERFLRRRWASR